MQTDLPLKRLTQLRPSDLLPLLGTPDAEVLTVESLELPASKTSLDTLLHLRQPDGTEYLHLIEWQGYRDPNFLWRTLGYLAWLGQNRRERPILATVVYLHPGDDVGDTVEQGTLGQSGWTVSLSCVRLWAIDAATALTSDTPGLAALSPLMAGATLESVERAVEIVLRQAAPSAQDELLTILGIFADDIVPVAHLGRLISKERAMSSTFIRHIFEEEFAVVEQREATLLQSLRQTVANTVLVRFPDVPARIFDRIRQERDHAALEAAQLALLRAADQAEAERVLAQLGER